MTRAELLDAAGERLSQAVILLTAAGEDCLAFQVEAVAEEVEAAPRVIAPRARAALRPSAMGTADCSS
jgi:hypothetical protein